jgi:hypothetical protein
MLESICFENLSGNQEDDQGKRCATTGNRIEILPIGKKSPGRDGKFREKRSSRTKAERESGKRIRGEEGEGLKRHHMNILPFFRNIDTKWNANIPAIQVCGTFLEKVSIPYRHWIIFIIHFQIKVTIYCQIFAKRLWHVHVILPSRNVSMPRQQCAVPARLQIFHMPPIGNCHLIVLGQSLFSWQRAMHRLIGFRTWLPGVAHSVPD